jgi:dTDP-4-amino-4,6-dideoxygalactose transaminase
LELIGKFTFGFEEANIESRPCGSQCICNLFCNYPYYGTKVAETLFEKGLCLPSGSNLTDEERTRIKRVVLNMFKNSAILVKDYI